MLYSQEILKYFPHPSTIPMETSQHQLLSLWHFCGLPTITGISLFHSCAGIYNCNVGHNHQFISKISIANFQGAIFDLSTHRTVHPHSHWTGLGCSRGRVPVVEVLMSVQRWWRSSAAAASAAGLSCKSRCRGRQAGTTLARWTGTWCPRCWTLSRPDATPKHTTQDDAA